MLRSPTLQCTTSFQQFKHQIFKPNSWFEWINLGKPWASSNLQTKTWLNPSIFCPFLELPTQPPWFLASEERLNGQGHGRRQEAAGGESKPAKRKRGGLGLVADVFSGPYIPHLPGEGCWILVVFSFSFHRVSSRSQWTLP